MTNAAATPLVMLDCLPADPDRRMILLVLRRLAIHGIHDAHAAMIMLSRFGIGYRRPLLHLRIFVHELALASTRRVRISPCCAGRTTPDERHMLHVLEQSNTDPQRAGKALRTLTGGVAALPALSAAMAFGQSLADLGAPLLPGGQA